MRPRGEAQPLPARRPRTRGATATDAAGRRRRTESQFAALREQLVRAPLQHVGVARSALVNHEVRNRPEVSQSGGHRPRACAYAHAGGARKLAHAGTGPPSLAHEGQGRRPFRCPARVEPVSAFQGRRCNPPVPSCQGFRRAGRHTKMAATRMGLAGLALSRSWGKARQQDRVARLPAHVARLHHGRKTRPPRPVGFFPAAQTRALLLPASRHWAAPMGA